MRFWGWNEIWNILTFSILLIFLTFLKTHSNLFKASFNQSQIIACIFKTSSNLFKALHHCSKKEKKNRMSNKNQDLYYWTKRNQGSIYFSSQCLQVWQILKADSASCKRGKFYHQWPWWKKALEWLKGLQMFRPSKNFRGFIDPQRYLGALGFKWPPGGFKGHWCHRL